jgi:hypothetical protein
VLILTRTPEHVVTRTLVDNRIQAYHIDCLKYHKYNLKVGKSDNCDYDDDSVLNQPGAMGIPLLLPEVILTRCTSYIYKIPGTRG